MLSCVKGIGKAREKQLQKLGIETIADLVHHYPRDYQDRTCVKHIMNTADGERCTIIGYCKNTPNSHRIRGKLDLLKFTLDDGTGRIEAVFFNQSWLKDKIERGGEYMLYGKVEIKNGKRQMSSPAIEQIKEGESPRIIPIYRLTQGLSQGVLRNTILRVLSDGLHREEEILPDYLLAKYSLLPAHESLCELHNPSDIDMLVKARKRAVFEEFLLLQLGLAVRRKGAQTPTDIRIAPCDMDKFYEQLPFELTEGQKGAIGDALADFNRERAMARLLQGDVGSGKTAVAAALAYACANSGYQSALMAPTEILARQHHATLSNMLAPFGIEVLLLVSSLKASEKKAVYQKLASSDICVAVGTNALATEKTQFANLGLVITDEQHRFGVGAKDALSKKGREPHTLVMSATPIPRTLALIIYGDLDISILSELPKGRQKVDTMAIGEDKRARLDSFVMKELQAGRQAFVVCPLVEQSDEGHDNLKDVESYVEVLKEKYAPYRVEFLHGKQKAATKEAVMSDFSKGEVAVLVSTTVVEVGIDVPNATVMIVEDAQRFGLSQLHQLRGRVGRGKHKSYCVLIATEVGENARERLSTIVKCHDGFEIAQKDLEMRGPGEFFGQRQHGLPEMKLAKMTADNSVLELSTKAKDEILSADDSLSLPIHKKLAERVLALWDSAYYG